MTSMTTPGDTAVRAGATMTELLLLLLLIGVGLVLVGLTGLRAAH